VAGHATVRFYAELNDFLAPPMRQRDLTVGFDVAPSVKDLVESLGIPHTEVDLVLVNGEPATWADRVAPGSRLAVYPVFETLDIGPVNRLRPEPLRVPRFLCDTHLGRLARHLRLLGFDTVYGHDWDDRRLAELSARERRILLTRDVGLLKRSVVTHGYRLRSTDPETQAREVVVRFDLAGRARPFTRCLACNGELEVAPPEAVADRVPADVARRGRDLSHCRACGRIYWAGSHHPRLAARVARLLGDPGPTEQP
jgi:uncharacterized protein with PIN domain